MADLASVVAVIFHLAVASLLLSLAGFLLFARPAHPSARVLGLVTLVSAVFPLMNAAVPLAREPSFIVALGRTAEDFLLLGWALTIVFYAVYPTRARGRAWIVYGAAFALLAAQIVVWLAARDWLVGAPRYRATLAWQMLSPYATSAGLLGELALLLAYRRVRALAASERTGARVVLGTLGLAVWFAPSTLILFAPDALRAATSGAAFSPPAAFAVPNDPFVSPVLWVAAFVALPLAIALHQALREDDRLPLVYTVIGALFATIGLFAGVDTTPAGAIITATMILYAVARHGALGIRSPSPAMGSAIAALVGVGVFFVVHSTIISMGPENPLLLTAGLVAGSAAGVAAAGFSLPRARSLLDAFAPADTSTTRERIEPYRVVLHQEIAAGTPREALREKLRPLRASLGVSDQEHAVLEYVATASGGATLAAREVVPGRRFLDRYRVARTLREGGVGVTHLCHDERVGRDVVLKTLRPAGADPAALDALLQEARALGRIAHPSVVTLLDADRIGDEAFLVMEYVTGGSLADRLQRGALPPDEFRALAEDLLQGLAAVHAAGLTHRDVKPSNVLLTGAGRAKLADFGIAHLPGFETTAAVALDASVVGTIRYMSPEQARGRPVGPRSDLYSAALLLYEAWTGTPYFEPRPAESAVELQLRVASAAGFERAWDGPAPMRAFFERALQPTPGARYQTVNEMLDGLRARSA